MNGPVSNPTVFHLFSKPSLPDASSLDTKLRLDLGEASQGAQTLASLHSIKVSNKSLHSTDLNLADVPHTDVTQQLFEAFRQLGQLTNKS